VQVKWANHNSLPFIVKNRGHSLTSSAGNFKGVQVDMSGLSSIQIQASGKTAWFQGGAYDGEAIQYLWDRGYVASECRVCC